jgi:ribosomal protein L37AE/L43A
MSVRFTQSCPTCGRRVEIRASLLGSLVACQHCKAEFVAMGDDVEFQRSQATADLMRRIDRVLEQTQPAAPVSPSPSSMR